MMHLAVAVLAGIGAFCNATQPCASETASAEFLLWQTNSAGDDIHIFNAESGALVHRLVVGPQPHGIAVTADHRTVFVTVEANGRPVGQLLWIDTVSFDITRRVELCREPHALAASTDGKWLYVPCRDGRYWVVDGTTGAVQGRVSTGGRPHNTQVSADGRYAYLSPMGAPHAVTVIDIANGHDAIGRIAFGNSVRPSALSADGRWLIQHVDGLNGFEVADTEERAVIATVRHSTPLDGFLWAGGLGKFGFQGFARCHGLAIRPDEREIWSVCADHITLHALRQPDFPELAAITLPSPGYWITFSPDGRYAYVALADDGEVAIIGTDTRRVLRRLKAGRAPKRNIVTRAVN